MGIDLVRGSVSDDFSMSFRTWDEVRALAVEFGWQPAGTLYPIYEYEARGIEITSELAAELERNWKGWYCSNDWARVTDNDAMAFSLALYRAINAVIQNLKVNPAQRRELDRWIDEPAWDPFGDLREQSREVDWRRIERIAEYLGHGAFLIA